jgi:hypothetical protein
MSIVFHRSLGLLSQSRSSVQNFNQALVRDRSRSNVRVSDGRILTTEITVIVHIGSRRRSRLHPRSRPPSKSPGFHEPSNAGFSGPLNSRLHHV